MTGIRGGILRERFSRGDETQCLKVHILLTGNERMDEKVHLSKISTLEVIME